MKTWQERFDDAHKKFIADIARKGKSGERAKQLSDKIYSDFFRNRLTTAFQEAEKKLSEKYDVRPSIPKENEYNFYRIIATLSVYEKGKLPSSEFSGYGSEVYEYKISAEISTDIPLITSSYHFLYRDDVRRSPKGDIVNRSDYENISVEDICNDIIHGYERMISEGVH